jgi:hypothetical protein
VQVPPISYTRSGDVAIAYQVLGDGPIDLVFVPEFSNLIWYWQHPLPAGFFRDLASFSRLILLDKRGVGPRIGRVTSVRSRRAWTTFARSSTPSARIVRRCSA